MMPVSPLLTAHIGGAAIGLISGYLAMLLRKGSNLHRLAGDFFVGDELRKRERKHDGCGQSAADDLDRKTRSRSRRQKERKARWHFV